MIYIEIKTGNPQNLQHLIYPDFCWFQGQIKDRKMTLMIAEVIFSHCMLNQSVGCPKESSNNLQLS